MSTLKKEEKEVIEYREAFSNIEKSKLIMGRSIQLLLVKGYTFKQIAGILHKNSRQTVFEFYRDYIKKIKIHE